MTSLSNAHDFVRSLIGERIVHFVDAPMYGNVGDLLIMLGTLEFFQKHSITPAIIATHFNYSPSEPRKNSAIVFQGGGNFGDLYKGPQQIRESVIAQNPNSRIIILPQTIHFKSSTAFEQCRSIFQAHKDTHVIARDLSTLEIAKQLTPNTYLAPDMAHNLWGTPDFTSVPHEKRLGQLVFARSDDELQTDRTLPEGSLRTDWPTLVGIKRTRLLHASYYSIKALHSLGLNKSFRASQMRLWIREARIIAKEATELFNQFAHVTTDRLHGHILSSLLSIPNTIIDNSYGKNSNYYQAWMKTSPIVSIQE